MTTRYYDVAGHRFCVAATDAELLPPLEQYAPFAVDDDGADAPVFSLTVVGTEQFPRTDNMTVELRQDDDGSQITVGRLSDGRPCFETLLWGRRAARVVTTADYRQAVATLEGDRLFGLNNTLMILYALSTARRGTALFHSSVVSCGGRAYMFLGPSGTGKSTHSGLWLRHISGTELLNDDNPVVRVMPDGRVVVSGSPWSGKTPCYRNLQLPLGAIVRLSQAPHNSIRRLRPLEAYATLVASISGKRWDAAVADGLHQTEEALTRRVAVWHLDCLPDEAAARLCHHTITPATHD